MKKIQLFFENYVFRKNCERLVMLMSTGFIVILFCAILPVKLPSILYAADADATNERVLLAGLTVISLLYVLLMRKMITQYRKKHQQYDKIHWRSGWKGKRKVIIRWFDRGD